MSTEEQNETGVQEEEVDYKTLYEQEKATRQRILGEKKSVKEQFESLQTQLDEIKQKERDAELAKLSVEDKYKLQLEEKDSTLAQYREQLESSQKQFEQLNRKIAINQVTGDISFAPGVPADVRDYSINKAFEGVNLDDATAIHEAKAKFTQDYKSLILSKTPASGGSQEKVVGQDSEATITTELTKEQYAAMSREDRMKISSEERARLMAT